ncbi:sulfotransferase family protein [Amorphoplanes nipponensis]|uniref:Sulfotransferase family protein n=1 Tax=Actinoplanes nipponensis TaxID=135950 RepID=A0A919JFI1_9ACTN|nr:sulfotransferase family protein [Actinoplanes nipponensis]GIE48375.1 sulfotransferase family protein [Actinoplanes nipponensis]
MDVIGVGFGRTGTLSLKIALEMLGRGPCLHMLPVLDDPERATLFRRAAEGDVAALDQALDGHRFTVDWPGAFFWRELTERHPDAKVVLTVRDPQRWYDSAYGTIFEAARHAPRTGDDSVTAGLSMIQSVVWEGTFAGRFADREHAVRVFTEHNEAVRRAIPARRLLEFEVSQGWPPLCDFLGVPAPDAPFPRVNDAESFRARIQERRGAGKL